MKNASLLVVQGVEQGTRFELGDRPMAVGRDARNDIRILDSEVSRNHATVQKVKENFVLTDRNSSNGTLVNGSAIRSHVLVDGDQIQLGNTLLLFSGVSPFCIGSRKKSHAPRLRSNNRCSGHSI